MVFFINGGGHRPSDIVYADRTGNNYHPTEKPEILMRKIINWTKGEVVLDPFMGSGTTGVACVDLKRKFIGIEINEKYFDIACKRIEIASRQGVLDFGGKE
jgi:site-specific DNA-methyltransferase (adenine-specific)